LVENSASTAGLNGISSPLPTLRGRLSFQPHRGMLALVGVNTVSMWTNPLTWFGLLAFLKLFEKKQPKTYTDGKLVVICAVVAIFMVCIYAPILIDLIRGF
jgi:hypothetical protein